MALITIPCTSTVEISGKVKVVKKGFATGHAAQDAAIFDAIAEANHQAQSAMEQCRCEGNCLLTFQKSPTVRIRNSGSQINPEFELIGLAVAIWTVFPECVTPPAAPLPPAAPAPQPLAPPPSAQPEPPDVSTPLPPVAIANPYPYTRTNTCGKITIHIAGPGEEITKGGILFDFEKNPTPCDACPSGAFGWIQHVQGAGGAWRYDNGVRGGALRRFGAPLRCPVLCLAQRMGIERAVHSNIWAKAQNRRSKIVNRSERYGSGGLGASSNPRSQR